MAYRGFGVVQLFKTPTHKGAYFKVNFRWDVRVVRILRTQVDVEKLKFQRIYNKAQTSRISQYSTCNKSEHLIGV